MASSYTVWMSICSAVICQKIAPLFNIVHVHQTLNIVSSSSIAQLMIFWFYYATTSLPRIASKRVRYRGKNCSSPRPAGSPQTVAHISTLFHAATAALTTIAHAHEIRVSDLGPKLPLNRRHFQSVCARIQQALFCSLSLFSASHLGTVKASRRETSRKKCMLAVKVLCVVLFGGRVKNILSIKWSARQMIKKSEKRVCVIQNRFLCSLNKAFYSAATWKTLFY